MTTEESIKILAVLSAAYPGRIKATPTEASGIATVWAIQFATVPVDIVYLALQKAITECIEHPPTPGKVKQKLNSLYWDAYSVLNDYGNKDLDEATKQQYKRIADITSRYKTGMLEPELKDMLSIGGAYQRFIE